MSVASSLRFSASHPCPICGGHDGARRGEGERCYGFTSEDGAWAHCTRPERAGGLEQHPNSGTYAHRLTGDCRCGTSHDPHPAGATNGHRPKTEIIATYSYRDGNAELLYQTVRFRPKDFRQRRPDGPGGWAWNLQGVLRVLYRLPELLAADLSQFVYIPEGEADVDRLASLGRVATTNVGGAGKWKAEYAECLRGRHVVILPDNDEAGRKHAEQVARSLYGIAASVRVLALPGLPDKGDVSDWLDDRHSPEELERLVAEAPILDARFPYVANRENRENRASGRFALTTLEALLAEPQQETEYIVEDMLPAGGVSMLAAKPKVGKTTLARNLAVAQARGDPFLGRSTAKGPVVYLALEEKRWQVAKHFARMGASNEPIYVHVGSAPKEALEALRAAIAEHAPVLAIVDPVFKLVRIRDGNDYAEVSRAYEPLIELARSTGCHILCVHHMSKGERSGGDAILGSTALFGAVDTALLMKRRDPGRTIETVQRYGVDLPETVVALDDTTGLVSPAGEMAALQLHQAGEAVLDAVGDEHLTEPDIRQRVGDNQSLTGKAIRQLVTDERLVRSGAGKRNDPCLYGKPGADQAGGGAVTPPAGDTPDSRFSRLPHRENRENRETEEGADDAEEVLL